MTLKLFLMIITCVTLSALSQIVMKLGMSSPQVQLALENGALLNTVWTVGKNFYVIFGLSLYVIGAGLWLLVLSKIDVSLAYPFVGLGFILIMLLGWLFLHEPVSAFRIIGTLMIAVGVYLVSQS